MSHKHKFAIFASVAAVSLLAAGAAFAQDAPAASRTFEGVIVGPDGKTSDVTRTVTAADGTRAVNTTLTGPNGAVRTQSDTRTLDRDAGVSNSTQVTTFADGSTRTVTGSAVKTDAGAWDTTRTVTTRTGEVRTQTGSATVEKTDAGRTVSGTQTGPAGDSSFTRSVARDDGARTVTAERTGPNGATGAYTSTTNRATGEFNSNRTQTGANGKTRSVDTTATRSGNAVAGTRTVTRPDGQTRSVSGAGRVSRKR